MLNDYKDMLSALHAAGVEYLVVRAHALGAHGIIRGSLDFDIWIRPSQENAERLWNALVQFGAPLSQVTKEDFAKPGTIFQR